MVATLLESFGLIGALATVGAVMVLATVAVVFHLLDIHPTRTIWGDER